MGSSFISEGDPSGVAWAVCGQETDEGLESSPLCLFWMVWRERNRVAFENEDLSIQRMKFSFVSNCGLGPSVVLLTSLILYLTFLCG